MKVYNMESRNGNKVANQFEIYDNGKVYFQSYESLIAEVEIGGSVVLGRDWDYSRTTMKYLNIFLRDHAYFTFKDVDFEISAKSIRKLIDNGTIVYNAEMV